VKVYTLDGRYADATLGEGLFRTQPEGLALYACEDGSGYWITTDQDEQRNVFHLFDRRTLEHAGAFTGVRTRNTDGIWLAQQPLPAFPQGAFFAVHDDQAVSAFDWSDIVGGLGLRTCAAHRTASAARRRAPGGKTRMRHEHPLRPSIAASASTTAAGASGSTPGPAVTTTPAARHITPPVSRRRSPTLYAPCVWLVPPGIVRSSANSGSV
jgi:hypothetical protein